MASITLCEPFEYQTSLVSLHLVCSSHEAVVSIEDAECQVVRVLHHQTNQKPIVTHIISFNDNLLMDNNKILHFAVRPAIAGHNHSNIKNFKHTVLLSI
jgi:hypothetical protein